MFGGGDGGIAVAYGTRGDEDDRAGWKLDNETEFNKYKMPATFRIVVAQGTDRTPAVRNVSGIAVASTAATRAQVKRTGWPHCVFEGAYATRIIRVQRLGFVRILFVQFWRVGLKGGWRYATVSRRP